MRAFFEIVFRGIQLNLVCLRDIFLNHLAPPSKGELMSKTPSFFFFVGGGGWGLRVHVISLV